MSPSLPAVVAVSMALGVRHAFEPDHLAAVSTLATRSGRALQAAWLGLAWGLGHTASVAVVALLLIAGGLTLPARLWPAAGLAGRRVVGGPGGPRPGAFPRRRLAIHPP